MNKLFIVVTAVLLLVPGIANAGNEVEMVKQNHLGGRIVIPRLKITPGKTQKLAIQLLNSVEYTAFQAEFYFPEGISPVKTADGNYSVSLSSRKTNHSISANIVSDGCLKVAAYSFGNESLKGNSGDLFYIDITSESTFIGPATVEVKGILFTQTSNRKEVAFSDVNGILDTHTPIKGDVNGDGTVNTADVEEIANYIMGTPSDKFDSDAADVNNDEVVNAADIVQINKMIPSYRQRLNRVFPIRFSGKSFFGLRNNAYLCTVEH